MKKLLPLLTLLLVSLVPQSVFAVGELCTGSPPTSSCCTAPAVVEDGGGCPAGTKWIGDAVTGKCKTTITCGAGVSYLNCLNGSCYVPPAPPTPLVCSYSALNTDSSKPCCVDGQVAVRTTDYANYPTGWRCSTNLFLLLGTGSATIGASSNVATGQNSLASGSSSTASGDYSVALGYTNVASGSGSVALGYSNSASNTAASALGGGFNSATNAFDAVWGYGNTASGGNATAWGYVSTASGVGSTAMGDMNTASGMYSVAMGSQTNAVAQYSVTMGNFSTAESFDEVVLGRWNMLNPLYSRTTWVDTDPLFVVGNGSSDIGRRNALTVLKNGNVGINTATPGSELVVADGPDADSYGSVSADQYCLGGGACLTGWPAQNFGWFVGATTGAPFNGSQGGYTNVNNKCLAAYAGSHVCTADEMISSYNNTPTGPIAALASSVWVNSGPPSYIVNVTNDCQGWQSSGSTIFGYVWDGTKDASFVTPCNLTRQVACCK